jgi:hypothetical protein
MPKRRKFSISERDMVSRRAHGICEYCRSPESYTPDTFEMEHIVPLVSDGSNEFTNLAFSCGGCNGRKGVKMTGLDPLTLQTVALFHPRQDRWRVHFHWNADATLLEGITPTGRATIAALQLNRLGCVNLRIALIALGMHPIDFADEEEF